MNKQKMEIPKLALRLDEYRSLRGRDEAWSRDVQAGVTSFDADKARGIRTRYDAWEKAARPVMEQVHGLEMLGVPVEGAEEFREAWFTVVAILRTDVEQLIRSMEDMAAGRVEPLTP